MDAGIVREVSLGDVIKTVYSGTGANPTGDNRVRGTSAAPLPARATIPSDLSELVLCCLVELEAIVYCASKA